MNLDRTPWVIDRTCRQNKTSPPNRSYKKTPSPKILKQNRKREPSNPTNDYVVNHEPNNQHM